MSDQTSSESQTDTNGLPPGYRFRDEYEITVHDALAKNAGPDEFLIVDVREAHELETAAIAPVLHIPLGALEQRLDEIQDYAEDHPDAQIAFLCRTGVRSMKAALALRAHGVPNAFNIAGGIHAWSHAIDPTLTRY